MSDPLIMQRKDGESDEEFAARVGAMMREAGAAPAAGDDGDDEQF